VKEGIPASLIWFNIPVYSDELRLALSIFGGELVSIRL
jgi:hypothetical protein